MSEQITQDSIRDTDTYVYQYDSGADVETLFHCVNDLNGEVTIEFFATRQEDSESFDDAINIGELVIGANESDYETLTDNWEEIQLRVTASSVPSNGSFAAYAMT